ncbi:SusC/RagA family TonB-linked outer membrane protein [Daejeonella sp.]|uniref:SusC/RagA family TonB-linked outer membrane protein n=1 Tax=Daejeonella sp. TaxID=2805397 RepID=UPI0039836956
MCTNSLLYVFRGKHLALLTIALCCSLTAFSQTPTRINGTVTDSLDSGPLPGVSVIISGTTKGTVTDLNGKYSIEVIPNSTLVFKFIGYQEEAVYVGNQTIINVSLSTNNQGLDEVIVVAFGTQKKESVTGAIASIQTKEIKQSPSANLAVTLAGRLPGLTALQRSGEPGRDLTQIFIRGQGTVNAQSPIILVDGEERDLTYIDPNEVESVTILKDASSTAIFGVRGANGVILVTTKRGESEIPEINVTTETAAQGFTRLADPVNAFDFATLRNLAQRNDGKGDAYSPQALEAYRSGSDPLRYPNTDWNDLLIKDYSLQQRFNLNISGAGKAVRYFVNAGVLNQGGQFKIEKGLNYDPSFKLNRYNFRSNIDLQINPTLKSFLNIAGYLEKQNSPFGVGVASTGQGGASPSLFILANIFDLPSNIPGPLSPDNGVVTTPIMQNPPFGILNRTGYRQQTRSNVTATYGMEQKLDFITSGLSAKAVISFDSRALNNLNASKSYVRKLQVIDPVLKGADGRDSVYFRNFANDVESPLSITGSNGFSSLSNFQAYVNYNRTFGKHNLDALLLYYTVLNLSQQNRKSG